jgi:hypothetical protein
VCERVQKPTVMFVTAVAKEVNETTAQAEFVTA